MVYTVRLKHSGEGDIAGHKLSTSVNECTFLQDRVFGDENKNANKL